MRLAPVQFGKITVTAAYAHASDMRDRASMYVQLSGPDLLKSPIPMSSDSFTVSMDKGRNFKLEYYAAIGNNTHSPVTVEVPGEKLKPLVDAMRQGHSPEMWQQLKQGFDLPVLQRAFPSVVFKNVNGPQQYLQGFAEGFQRIAEAVDACPKGPATSLRDQMAMAGYHLRTSLSRFWNRISNAL